jgi:hypothetical protein
LSLPNPPVISFDDTMETTLRHAKGCGSASG